MATIKPVILAQNIREDGTWRIAYRLTHQRKSRYIPTSHYIDRSSLDKSMNIKTDFIINYLSEEIKEYRSRIGKLSSKIDRMDIDDVKKHITSQGEDISFLDFMDEWIKGLSMKREKATVDAYTTVYNLLNETFPKGIIAQQINKKTIQKVIDKCKERRTSDYVTNIYITKFKKVFTEARKKYNDIDADLILIPNNPFDYWEPLQAEVKVKKKAISLKDIRAIRDYKSKINGFASKIFMLSIYLCGINFIDLFQGCEKFVEEEYIGYSRRKSHKKRSDDAYIRMKKTPEIQRLLEYFIEQKKLNPIKSTFHNRVSRGLKRVAEDLEFDYKLTLYHGRHSFATIARNDCGFSKDDVSDALNHIDEAKKVTDIYIKKDYSNVERVQAAVIEKINEDLEILNKLVYS